MTPDEWASVFEAGAGVLGNEDRSPRDDLKAALLAMAAGAAARASDTRDQLGKERQGRPKAANIATRVRELAHAAR
jgi:malonate decarboxylase gamma subunit